MQKKQFLKSFQCFFLLAVLFGARPVLAASPLVGPEANYLCHVHYMTEEYRPFSYLSGPEDVRQASDVAPRKNSMASKECAASEGTGPPAVPPEQHRGRQVVEASFSKEKQSELIKAGVSLGDRASDKLARQATGFSVEVWRLVMDRLGCTSLNLIFYPWARGYKNLLENQNTALFSMGLTENRLKLFKFAGPITLIRYALVARKSSGMRIKKLEDVAAHTVGVRQEGWAEGYLNAHVPSARTVGSLRIEFAVHQVERGRLDLFAYAEQGVPALLHSMNLDPEDFEVVYSIDSASPYFGFHRDVPQRALDVFQKTLDAVRASPQYRALEEKYFN